jgi:hypothetical protein
MSSTYIREAHKTSNTDYSGRLSELRKRVNRQDNVVDISARDNLQDRLNCQLEAKASSYKTQLVHLTDVEFAIKHGEHLNSWERDFVTSLAGFSRLSEKQRDKLDLILQKIRYRTRLPGRKWR